MAKETKQFFPGDRVRVVNIRDGLGMHGIGDTAIVLNSYYDLDEPVLRLQWDDGNIPTHQRCYADQFEIVIQIKAMDDTREYLEAITGGSSNG